MHIQVSDINKLKRIERINLINSITGIKPVNLIGTISKQKTTNLAIFNSVFHLGSNPALLGFISRPESKVQRHTLENIRETGFYSINQVHEAMAKQAHYTSAKFDEDVSEFDACKLSEEYLADFEAPYVGESLVKIGMELIEFVPMPINGTIMVIGKIKHIFIPHEALTSENILDLSAVKAIGVSGLNDYYRLDKLDAFPYARVKELPNF